MQQDAFHLLFFKVADVNQCVRLVGVIKTDSLTLPCVVPERAVLFKIGIEVAPAVDTGILDGRADLDMIGMTFRNELGMSRGALA